MIKTLVSWSSGKDSAWMVHVLRQRGDVEIGGAADDDQRAGAARGDACRARRGARGAGRRARPAALEGADPVAVPERGLRAGDGATAVARAVAEGFTHVAFGDLFLEDIRRYREERLAGTGLTPLFPLFGADTARARARDDRRRAARADHLRRIRRCSIAASPAASSTRRCSPICRRRSIRAASAASFTPAPTPGRCSAARSRSTTGITVERDGFVFADLTIANQTR